MVNPFHKNQSFRLFSALWAYRTSYNTPLGLLLYRIVYEKAPIEIAYKAYWDIKTVNLNLNSIGPLQKYQLDVLEELRHDAYEKLTFLKKNKKYDTIGIFRAVCSILQLKYYYMIDDFTYPQKIVFKIDMAIYCKSYIPSWCNGYWKFEKQLCV